MSRKGITNFSEKEFNQIKTMDNEFGLSAEQIMGITGRSSATLSRVFSSDTWEDYRELIIQSNKKHYGQKNDVLAHNPDDSLKSEAATEAPKEDDPSVLPAILLTLTDISVSLKLIAANQDRLAKAWETKTPTKRSIF